MHVTTDVDHASRQEGDNLLQEPGVATFSRRIDNQCRLIAIPFEVLGDSVEQGFRSARVESDVIDGVDRRVVVCVRN